MFSIVYAQDATTLNAIDAHLNFGKYTDCLRPGGICTFKETTDKYETNTKVYYSDNNTLTLVVDRNQISPNTEFLILGEHLNNQKTKDEYYFVLEEPLTLDEQLLYSLKMEKGHIVAKGSYRVKVTNEHLLITLNLQKL